MKPLAIPGQQHAKNRLADAGRLLENCVEDRYQISGRGVDHLQHFGDRRPLGQRLVALGVGYGKLALKIGNHLSRINKRAVRLRAHLWTSRDRLSGRIIP
jgi:hypothetical protein